MTKSLRVTAPSRSPTAGEGPQLSRDAWIAAARERLIATGIEMLKVDQLARSLGVSRGSFYWHFESREDLLDALLESWRSANTAPFEQVLADHPGRPDVQFLQFCEIWLDPQRFDARFDSVVREWARSSKAAERMVQEADRLRMDVLRVIFLGFGYGDLEADVRARVVYYHQVGYYALRIDEPLHVRRQLFPTYFRVLAGMPMPQSLHESAQWSQAGQPQC